MGLYTRAGVAWLVLLAAMFANGAVRVLILQPPLGEDRARQVASLIGVALALVIGRGFVRLSPEAEQAQRLGVGLVWFFGAVAFEVVFGHFVSGLSWSALLADYDIARGRLWPLVLASIGLGPWFWGAVGGRRRI
jgi:hypothetical protein